MFCISKSKNKMFHVNYINTKSFVCLKSKSIFVRFQLKEVEASNKKWRNNKKDLDFQLNNVTKCHQEIVEQINEKTNDVKCIEMEIESFKNRIESDKKDLDIAQKSMVNKKKASDVIFIVFLCNKILFLVLNLYFNQYQISIYKKIY